MLVTQARKFNKTDWVLSKKVEHREFYSSFIETQIFSQFLADREKVPSFLSILPQVFDFALTECIDFEQLAYCPDFQSYLNIPDYQTLKNIAQVKRDET